MTDLEMVRLCARAMGMPEDGPVIEHGFIQVIGPYDPFHINAQAFALVKKLGLSIEAPCCKTGLWHVGQGNNPAIFVDENGREINASSDDLNRAIVECCAKLQAAKEAK